MIPKIIHFNFGLEESFGNKPFTLVHFLAIKSAKIVNQCEVRLYYTFSPENNVWWEKSKEYCRHIKINPLDKIFGHFLTHVAFKSDVLRLDLLNQEGGIYLDIDTICISPLDCFLENSFVLGTEMEDERIVGLCNAVIMAEKNSHFGKLWWDAYKNYNPDWGFMSVIVPHKLSIENPSVITVLSPEPFFKYSWTPSDIKKVHESVHPMDNAYVLHLWEQKSYDPYLRHLTTDKIKFTDTTYNLLARKFL